jgi:hypothetical protein
MSECTAAMSSVSTWTKLFVLPPETITARDFMLV